MTTTNMDFSTEIEYARNLDAQDELAHFRARFVIDDPDLIYLDGNSLGRLPRATSQLMRRLVDEGWGEHLIRSWGSDWIDAPERVGAKLAELLGASPDEIVVADSTSVNLFKLVVAALQAQPARRKIVTDDLNFPSDLYVLQGIGELLGRNHKVEVVKSPDSIHGPVEALAGAIDDDTAVVTLSHTTFKSGYTYDMAAITEIAKQAGALVIWDLSHSAGSVPIHLNQANADLAVGCTYKYLNGGPGSPAFLYIGREWQDKLANPISGWMGQRNPFDFDLDYAPVAGLRHFLSGTPPILSLSAIEPGVDLLLEAGMERVRAKSVRQTEYLVYLWGKLLAPLGYSLNSPRDVRLRGSHVSLGHEQGLPIDLALINELKVIPDFRYPDNIRLGITPLYTSFVDIHTAVQRLAKAVSDGLYERYSSEEVIVT